MTSHQGDENSSGDMGKVMAFLTAVAALGPAILYIHHAGKGAVVDGRIDAQAARGSGVITDHARGAFAMKPMAKAEAEKGLMWGTTSAMKKIEEDECWRFVNLSVSKSNNAAPLADVWLRKGEGGVLKYVEVLPTLNAARKSMDAVGGNGKKNRRADDAS